MSTDSNSLLPPIWFASFNVFRVTYNNTRRIFPTLDATLTPSPVPQVPCNTPVAPFQPPSMFTPMNALCTSGRNDIVATSPLQHSGMVTPYACCCKRWLLCTAPSMPFPAYIRCPAPYASRAHHPSAPRDTAQPRTRADGIYQRPPPAPHPRGTICWGRMMYRNRCSPTARMF